MAIYKIFPKKDSSIYSFYPEMNTGLDEIIEISKNDTSGISRSLIKFPQDEINNVINNIALGEPHEVHLRCFIALAENINSNYNIEVYKVTEPWDNGSGKYLDNPIITDGVSWTYKNSENTDIWNTLGGNWDNSNVVSQSFSPKSSMDLNVNISTLITSSIEGLMLKLDSQTESSDSLNIQPTFRFFSSDTHTIYPPQLEVKWDDSVYNTGSLPNISELNIYTNIENNKGNFYEHEIAQFRINSRPLQVVRTYSTTSVHASNYCLPITSYYAIKDLDTNEYVIDFDDNYTRISCDEKGNYFNLYMSGLQPERYYKIILKIVINGNTIIKDNHYTFKVIN